MEEGVIIHKLHSEMTWLVKRYFGYILAARLIADVPVMKHEELSFMSVKIYTSRL